MFVKGTKKHAEQRLLTSERRKESSTARLQTPEPASAWNKPNKGCSKKRNPSVLVATTQEYIT